MKVSFNPSDLFSIYKSPVKGNTVELPDFEEAFDTSSLRKFYQQMESTNSQSCYTPQQEDSLSVDLDPEVQSLLQTPFNRYLSDFNSDEFVLKLSRKLSFDSDIDSEDHLSGMEFPVRKSEDIFIFRNNTQLKDKVLENKEEPKSKVNEKSKKIFKIERNVRPSKPVENVKNKAGKKTAKSPAKEQDDRV